jgi:hypothetical protein
MNKPLKEKLHINGIGWRPLLVASFWGIFILAGIKELFETNDIKNNPVVLRAKVTEITRGKSYNVYYDYCYKQKTFSGTGYVSYNFGKAHEYGLEYVWIVISSAHPGANRILEDYNAFYEYGIDFSDTLKAAINSGCY